MSKPTGTRPKVVTGRLAAGSNNSGSKTDDEVNDDVETNQILLETSNELQDMSTDRKESPIY